MLRKELRASCIFCQGIVSYAEWMDGRSRSETAATAGRSEEMGRMRRRLSPSITRPKLAGSAE